MAQVRRQRLADGSEAMAIARFRWHRTFLILIARFVILEVMKVKSHATPMHHQMIMVSSAIRLAGD